jgi:hypothetical protein
MKRSSTTRATCSSRYAPVLITSAATAKTSAPLRFHQRSPHGPRKAHQHRRVETASSARAMAETLPPTIGNKRLKLFYATQSAGDAERAIDPAEVHPLR